MNYLDSILTTLGLPLDAARACGQDEYEASERWVRDPLDRGRAEVVRDSAAAGALFPLSAEDRDRLLVYAEAYWKDVMYGHQLLLRLGLQGSGNPSKEARAALDITGLTAKHVERVLRTAHHKITPAKRVLPEYLSFDPRDYEIKVVEGAERLVAVGLKILPETAWFAGAFSGGGLGLGEKLGRMIVVFPDLAATYFPVSLRSTWRRLRDRVRERQILDVDRGLTPPQS